MRNEVLMLPVAIQALRMGSAPRVAKCWLACLVALIFLDLAGRSVLYKAILVISLGGAEGRVGEQMVDWAGGRLSAGGAQRWWAVVRAWCWLVPLWVIQMARGFYHWMATLPCHSSRHRNSKDSIPISTIVAVPEQQHAIGPPDHPPKSLD